MILLRPHHLMCLLSFRGYGYSDLFTRNFKSIHSQVLSKCENTINLQITQYADTICKPCPHRRGTGCKEQDKINSLDRAHSEALNIKHGDQLSWKQAKQKIVANVNEETFHKICQQCSWKEYGYCQEALNKLHASHQSERK